MKNQIELLQDLLWEIRELRKAVDGKNEKNERVKVPTEADMGATFDPVLFAKTGFIGDIFGDEDKANLTFVINLKTRTRRLICSKCEEELPNDRITFKFAMCPFCGAAFRNGGEK